MKRKKSPVKKGIPSPASDPKWHFEQETEASILGSHFARAVATIAYGQFDEGLETRPKTTTSPFRKIFYEEPMNNPGLAQAHVSAAYDAHEIEEQKHWHNGGNSFASEKRKFTYPPDQGPKKPIEFPYVFERPIVAYERKGTVRPFAERYRITSEARRHHGSEESNSMEFGLPFTSTSKSTSSLPQTYHSSYHDPWKEASKPICGMIQQSSAFKSATERFPALSDPYNNNSSSSGGGEVIHHRPVSPQPQLPLSPPQYQQQISRSNSPFVPHTVSRPLSPQDGLTASMSMSLALNTSQDFLTAHHIQPSLNPKSPKSLNSPTSGKNTATTPKGNTANRPRSAVNALLNSRYQSTEDMLEQHLKTLPFLQDVLPTTTITTATTATNNVNHNASVESLMPSITPITMTARAHTANEAIPSGSKAMGTNKSDHFNHNVVLRNTNSRPVTATNGMRTTPSSYSLPSSRPSSRQQQQQLQPLQYQHSPPLQQQVADPSMPSLSHTSSSFQSLSEHEETAPQTMNVNNASSPKKNFHENMLSKWTPPMCYSRNNKQSLQAKMLMMSSQQPSDNNNKDHHKHQKRLAMVKLIDANYPIINIHGNNGAGGAGGGLLVGPGMEDYVVHKQPVISNMNRPPSASASPKLALVFSDYLPPEEEYPPVKGGQLLENSMVLSKTTTQPR